MKKLLIILLLLALVAGVNAGWLEEALGIPIGDKEKPLEVKQDITDGVYVDTMEKTAEKVSEIQITNMERTKTYPIWKGNFTILNATSDRVTFITPDKTDFPSSKLRWHMGDYQWWNGSYEVLF
jgi:hypothetical protein